MLLQDDSTSYSVARSTMDWYGDNGDDRMDWLDHSTNLKLIISLWDKLDPHIKKCTNHPNSAKELTCHLKA
ncbi:hypothetical protein TNCV_3900081 [Trichonephila clavipes]|nr:hypothetical protein TNCV_3900081 [Trichonephila clavipes]